MRFTEIIEFLNDNVIDDITVKSDGIRITVNGIDVNITILNDHIKVIYDNDCEKTQYYDIDTVDKQTYQDILFEATSMSIHDKYITVVTLLHNTENIDNIDRRDYINVVSFHVKGVKVTFNFLKDGVEVIYNDNTEESELRSYDYVNEAELIVEVLTEVNNMTDTTNQVNNMRDTTNQKQITLLEVLGELQQRCVVNDSRDGRIEIKIDNTDVSIIFNTNYIKVMFIDEHYAEHKFDKTDKTAVELVDWIFDMVQMAKKDNEKKLGTLLDKLSTDAYQNRVNKKVFLLKYLEDNGIRINYDYETFEWSNNLIELSGEFLRDELKFSLNTTSKLNDSDDTIIVTIPYCLITNDVLFTLIQESLTMYLDTEVITVANFSLGVLRRNVTVV